MQRNQTQTNITQDQFQLMLTRVEEKIIAQVTSTIRSQLIAQQQIIIQNNRNDINNRIKPVEEYIKTFASGLKIYLDSKFNISKQIKEESQKVLTNVKEFSKEAKIVAHRITHSEPEIIFPTNIKDYLFYLNAKKEWNGEEHVNGRKLWDVNVYSLLRQKHWMNPNKLATQQYIDAGYFTIIDRPQGKVTFITDKGEEPFKDFLIQEGLY
jgi:hypothetical protein